MANQDDPNDKYLSIAWSRYICIAHKPIIAYVTLNMTSFLFWILPMLPWSCPKTILGSSVIHRKATTTKNCISIAKSLTDTQHVELEPLCTARKK